MINVLIYLTLSKHYTFGMTMCGCALPESGKNVLRRDGKSNLQVGEVPDKMLPVSPKWWTLLPVEPFKYQRVVVGVLRCA